MFCISRARSLQEVGTRNVRQQSWQASLGILWYQTAVLMNKVTSTFSSPEPGSQFEAGSLTCHQTTDVCFGWLLIMVDAFFLKFSRSGG